MKQVIEYESGPNAATGGERTLMDKMAKSLVLYRCAYMSS